MFQPIDTDMICRLIAQLGREDFGDRFGEACAGLSGADQVTAFAVEEDGPRCLLAYRPRQGDLAAYLCRQYAAHYYERDRFLMSGISSGDFYLAGPVSIAEIGDEAYRSRLFAEAGLAGKFSILQRRGEGLVYLNLYFRELAADRRPEAFATLESHGGLLAETLAKHDSLGGNTFRRGRVEALLRDRFPALSPREVQVCASIVTGRSAEAIALELDLSIATVTTFRRRAYAKLGIASRSELFARCAGIIGN